MVEEQRLSESQNNLEVYKQNKKQILLLLLIPFTLFTLTLLFNIPVSSGIRSVVESKVLQTKLCPMTYKDMELSFFFPGINLKELTIPGRCYRRPRQAIHFNDVNFKMTFPSFWPIGIKTKAEARFEDTHINIYPRLTLSGHSIQISNTNITTKFINQLTPKPNMINGNFDVKGNFEIQSNQIDSAHLLINSKNLFIPGQSLSGIVLPALALQKFELAANIVKDKVQVKALRIGSSSADLQAEFKGTIALSKANLMFSKINLQGKFKISKTIQEAIPLIRLLLNRKKKKDGFYFINLGGTLGGPSPKIVDPQ